MNLPYITFLPLYNYHDRYSQMWHVWIKSQIWFLLLLQNKTLRNEAHTHTNFNKVKFIFFQNQIISKRSYLFTRNCYNSRNYFFFVFGVFFHRIAIFQRIKGGYEIECSSFSSNLQFKNQNLMDDLPWSFYKENV